MSLEHLHPFADQHAIQSAVFAVVFSTELDVGELSRLRQASSGLKSDFPNFQDQHRATLNVNFAPGEQIQPQSSTMDADGFILEKPGPVLPLAASFPLLRAVNVSRSSIVVIVNDYTRWEKFKSDVERYLSTLLVNINEQVGIAEIGIQIVDAFTWKADPSELNLAEIFSKKSSFLTPNSLSQTSLLWHSHHGYLTDQDGPPHYQQLDNVNVSRNVVSGLHQIQILTSHKATFTQPVYKFLTAEKTKVFTIVDHLHTTNKLILADLLSDELQVKINLNKPKD
jgi:uncharacterized protein (TIGR04255 family)